MRTASFFTRSAWGSLVALSFLCSSFAYGQVGVAGAQFLKIGQGASAMAMGGAFTAVDRDLTAAFWNPAGLATLPRTGVALSYTNWILDVTEQHVVVAIPTEIGVIGWHGVMMQHGTFEGRDATGARTADFGGRDLAVGASWSRRVGSHLLIGLQAKFIHQALEAAQASTVAFDAGLIWKAPWPGLTVGMSVLHVGPGLTFIRDVAPLPTVFRAGLSYEPSFLPVRVVVDASRGVDQSALNVGIEWAAGSLLAVRAGSMVAESGHVGIAAGLGLAWSDVRVDYAFTPTRDFGATHRLSFSYLVP